MRRFIALYPLVFHLFSLPDFGGAAPGNTNTSETISSSGTLDARNLSNAAPSTASPTITIVSYITVSNGTTSSAASISLALASSPCSINPDSYDCINTNLPPDWELYFANWYNPYDQDGGYFPPFSGYPTTTGSEDPTLSESCGDKWSSTFSQWLSTAETESHFSHAVSAYFSVSDPVFFDWRDFGSQYLVPYTASPPCCSACTLTFGDVQVYDWPLTPRPPLISTLVNAENSTFVYPSLYVAFRTLAGTDLCGYVGAPVTSVTTLAFDRSDLSTMNSYWFNPELYSTWWASGPDFSYTALESAIGTDCSNITTTLWGQSVLLTFDLTSRTPITASGWTTMINGTQTTVDMTVTWDPVPVTYNPCYPYLSIPSKIFTMSPQWSGCVKYMTGLRDPCIYMSTGAGFSAITPTFHGLPKPTGASAAPIFQQSTAAKTTPSRQLPTARPTENAAPPSQPPAPQITKMPVVVTMPGTSFTLNSDSALIINSQTVTRGGKITISEGKLSGTTVSLAADGQVLNVNGITQHLGASYLIGTQPITAGGSAVNIGGRKYSLVSGGSSIVIDGSTIPVDQATQGNILQQLSVPAYIIDGQTLVAGGSPVTSSGTILSLEPGGESVVIGGSTTVDISQLTGASSLMVTYLGGNSASTGARSSDGVNSTPSPLSGQAAEGSKRNSAQGTLKLSYQRAWLGAICATIGLGVFW